MTQQGQGDVVTHMHLLTDDTDIKLSCCMTAVDANITRGVPMDVISLRTLQSGLEAASEEITRLRTLLSSSRGEQGEHFVLVNGPDGACVEVVCGREALIDRCHALLWNGDGDCPEDVQSIIDRVSDPASDEWLEHGAPPHLRFEFEDGAIEIWRVDVMPSAPGSVPTSLAGQVPDGYVLAPRRMDETMLEAARATLPGPCDICDSDIEDIYETAIKVGGRFGADADDDVTDWGQENVERNGMSENERVAIAYGVIESIWGDIMSWQQIDTLSCQIVRALQSSPQPTAGIERQIAYALEMDVVPLVKRLRTAVTTSAPQGQLHWVACERCGGSGEIEVKPSVGPYDDPTTCAEICSACDGTGRFCEETYPSERDDDLAVPTSLAGQVPDGYMLVPKEPTLEVERSIAYAVAVARQGASSTPRFESPTEYDIDTARAWVRWVVAALSERFSVPPPRDGHSRDCEYVTTDGPAPCTCGFVERDCNAAVARAALQSSPQPTAGGDAP